MKIHVSSTHYTVSTDGLREDTYYVQDHGFVTWRPDTAPNTNERMQAPNGALYEVLWHQITERGTHAVMVTPVCVWCDHFDHDHLDGRGECLVADCACGRMFRNREELPNGSK